MYGIYWFMYSEPSLYHFNKFSLILVYALFIVLVFSWEFLNLYILGIQVFNSSLYFVIFLFLSGFVIKVVLASLDKFGEIPFFTLLFLFACLFLE